MDRIDIELRACDWGRNRFRAWRIEIGRDLFGVLTARVTFGRIGCTRRARQWDFKTEEAADAFLRASLRRRGSATKRLGTPYRLVNASPSAQLLLDGFGFGADRPAAKSGDDRVAPDLFTTA